MSVQNKTKKIKRRKIIFHGFLNKTLKNRKQNGGRSDHHSKKSNFSALFSREDQIGFIIEMLELN